jgi:hypothetical protein
MFTAIPSWAGEVIIAFPRVTHSMWSSEDGGRLTWMLHRVLKAGGLPCVNWCFPNNLSFRLKNSSVREQSGELLSVQYGPKMCVKYFFTDSFSDIPLIVMTTMSWSLPVLVLTAHFAPLFQSCLQWPHIGKLKFVRAGTFMPWKLSYTTE